MDSIKRMFAVTPLYKEASGRSHSIDQPIAYFEYPSHAQDYGRLLWPGYFSVNLVHVREIKEEEVTK